MNIFHCVTKLFQDKSAALAFANQADAMYRASVGEEPKAITIENEKAVASNLAGLYAADAAAQLLVLRDYGADGLTEARYLSALGALAGDTVLGDTSGFVVDLVANLAWRSGQPFLGLSRLERPVNKAFVLLSKEDRAKDRKQIKEGAHFILQWLAKEQATKVD